MIEATGLVSLVYDEQKPGIAVPDIVETWGDGVTGKLYAKLIELLGKDVYVLVLPKDEMTALCECGHIRADHLEFTNWDVDGFSKNATEPSLDEKHAHTSYVGTHPADTVYCKCRKFNA